MMRFVVSALRKHLCVVLLVIGVAGWWCAMVGSLLVLSRWDDHIVDNHMESGLRTLSVDKLEGASKGNLVALVRANESLLASEYKFSVAAFGLMLLSAALAFASSVAGTVGAIWIILSRRKCLRETSEAAQKSVLAASE